MKPLWILVIGFALSCRASSLERNAEYEREIRPVLMEFCGDCHKKKNAPFLTATNLSGISARRFLWHSVADQVRNRTMPPADEALPSEAQRLKIASWVEKVLRETACESGDFAGSVTSRRLNRFEYDNTIHDLLGLDLKFSETFPTDGGGGEGFNNNGETLFLPVILLERYMDAAQLILDNSIVSPPLRKIFLPPDFLRETNAAKTALGALASNQEMLVTAGILTTGDYTVKISTAPQTNAAATLVLKVDGIAAHRFTNAMNATAAAEAVLHLARGPHSLAFRSEGGPSEIMRLELSENQREPNAAKRAAHEKIFSSSNSASFAEWPADRRRDKAREILANFTRLAFRRPVAASELERFLTLYTRSADRGEAFEESVKLALKAVLVSPSFLFRIEEEPAKPGIHPIDDYELASRLSYFLWASMPDRELMLLADSGQLHQPGVISAQTKRMLADPKSRRFIEDFTGQWLGTREVGNTVAFTDDKYRGVYSTELANDLREEPVRIMQHLITDNRSLAELLDADYAFLTERTARHYGIKGVAGREFQKVALTNSERGGVIGLGAVHMITAKGDRTSPVLRGAWVLETILGTRVPPPPPDVPQLEATSKKAKSATLREQIQMHRANPVCAACHDVIDPIGFGMENYDLLGRWRENYATNQLVDASAVMPSGEKFNGPGELRKILVSRKDEFARHLTAKMLGYALGRSLEDRDDCSIEKIVSGLQGQNYPAGSLIQAIVLSSPFLNRQPAEASAPPDQWTAPKPKPKAKP